MDNKIFHVVVEVGRERVCKEIYACSLFHAIDMLYYKHNMKELQEDRTKYKQLKKK